MGTHAGPPERQHHGNCTACGKKRWLTRRAAKAAARALYPHDHLRAYRCGDAYHIGHLAEWVKAGRNNPREAL